MNQEDTVKEIEFLLNQKDSPARIKTHLKAIGYPWSKWRKDTYDSLVKLGHKDKITYTGNTAQDARVLYQAIGYKIFPINYTDFIALVNEKMVKPRELRYANDKCGYSQDKATRDSLLKFKQAIFPTKETPLQLETLKESEYMWTCLLITEQVISGYRNKHFQDKTLAELQQLFCEIYNKLKSTGKIKPEDALFILEAEWIPLTKINPPFGTLPCPNCGNWKKDAAKETCSSCGATIEEARAFKALVEANQNGDYLTAKKHYEALKNHHSSHKVKQELEILLKHEAMHLARQTINAIKPSGRGSVRVEGDRLVASWEAASLNGRKLDAAGINISPGKRAYVYYTVRREMDRLANESSETIVRTRELRYEDTKCKADHAYSYTVHTEVEFEGTVTPLQPGCAIGCEANLPADGEFYAREGDSKAELNWVKLPAGWSAELFRKEGATPANHRDGQQLRVPGGSNSFTDRNLKNNVLYGYRLILSHDVCRIEKQYTTSCVPNPPPPTLEPTQWRIMQRGLICEISYAQPPQADEVLWHYGSTLPGCTGNILPVESLRNAPTTVQGSMGKAEIPNLNLEGIYIVPLVVRNGRALICQPRFCGVARLRQKRDLGSVELSCDWPMNCLEIKAVYDFTAFPERHNDISAEGSTTMQKQADGRAHCMLYDLDERTCYISIFVRDSNGWNAPHHVKSVAPGKRPLLCYEVTQRNGMWYFIASCADGLPGIEVYAANGHLPLSRMDGKKALSITGAEKRVEYSIPGEFCSPGYCFMPFLDKNAGANNYIQVLRKNQLSIR